MNINFQIERIVLDGIDFDSRNEEMFRSAVTSELAALLGRQPHLASSHENSDSGNVDRTVVQTGVSKHRSLGQQLAREIHGTLGRDTNRAERDSGRQTP
ncbi:hypothetical protein [Novipirellula maiorica]|uniref:hypothetical protein n=1 Tax=Novipirellula maiorica TaxID=1265734 RepID=UPI00059519EC|nr:hypothetical protein [Rhodopirellula maiorica]